MDVIKGNDFMKSAGFLPENIQEKLATVVELLGVNYRHPFLHTKRLNGGLAKLLSCRITRDWRVIFYFIDANTIYISSVEHRKDAYR